jgi:class 3 adenylate cyclase
MGGSPDNRHEFPDGIVTFLLTDIEGSTPLWERHRAVMGAALAQHEAVVAGAVAAHGGHLIKTRGEGDSTVSVFVRASDAAAAALAMQRSLGAGHWRGGLTLPTRAALHTGEAELRDGDYYGQTLNRAARLRGLGRGGQVLLSRATAELVADQTLGSARHYLGLLAATMGRWDAVAQFQAAVQVHQRIGAVPMLARSRHHLAEALLARGPAAGAAAQPE